MAARYSDAHHGDFSKWQTAVDGLPPIDSLDCQYLKTVTLGGRCDPEATQQLRQQLEMLHPWRKGPFAFAGLQIDTEWRSDWKWQRVASGIGDLADHRVLDVGSGNGYFGWRMLEAGAREVVGIDPTLLFCMQHQAVQRYAQDYRNWVLPLGIEEIPLSPLFDSVFSMGVIYHRRDAAEHPAQLKNLLKPGGQLVLESLVVADPEGLVPEGRYARMRNVWIVPSVAQLLGWLEQAGFTNVRLIDETVTSLDEQRSTPWMHFESLRQALDPDDPSRTIEGHPAPIRATVVGDKPWPTSLE